MKSDATKFKEFRKWFGKYILRNFGKKCPDFTLGCIVCRTHFIKILFDDFVEEIIFLEKIDLKKKMVRKNRR